MKHSLAVKFIAVILSSLALLSAAIGAAGIWLLESNDLYTHSLKDQQDDWYDDAGQYIAWEYACRYAAKHLGSCSDTLLNRLYDENYYGMESDHWQISLFQDGKRISQTYEIIIDPVYREHTLKVEYPVATAIRDEQPEDTDAPAEEVPAPPLYSSRITIWENGEMVEYRLDYYESPVYTIHVQMHPDITQGTPNAALANMYPYRYSFIGILVAGLLIFAAGLVFLFFLAGKAHDGKPALGGLCRLPIDLNTIFSALLIWMLCLLLADVFRWSQQDGMTAGLLTLILCSAYAISLLLIQLLYSICAQSKQGDHYWWKHSLLGTCLKKIKACFLQLFSVLPGIWQWLLSFLISFILLAGTMALWAFWGRFTLFPWLFAAVCILSGALCLAILLYSAYAFGLLLKGAKNLNRGNLDDKISTKYLFGSYLDFANQLNTLSDTVAFSVKQQLKAEQMKTELITNVSHDIKTPLTSIINFVDLLQRPHTPEDQAQYLAILSRQSGRMKKLVEDLVELSKACTGNLTDNPTRINAEEALNQALGEFHDRLEKARITPVFHAPEQPMYILADGTLSWRVLSNLLSNVVKYATPDTRLYIDLVEDREQVILSLKNISREPLQVDAQELLERFVQGDTSRNTEGSGLGLNIAQSLMTVQHGQLELFIDGDLFKVAITFPKG